MQIGSHSMKIRTFYVVEELTRNIEAALSRLPESYREAFEMIASRI